MGRPLRNLQLTYKGMIQEKRGFFADWRKDLIATAGEFIGTVMFLFFSLGTIQTVKGFQAMGQSSGQDQATTPNPTSEAAFFYSAFAFGMGLFSTSTIFYRFTGSIFNPSVTLALLIIGAVRPLRFLLVCAAQMVGSIVACALLDALSPMKLDVGVELQNGTNRTRGLFIEAFATAALILSVLMLAAEKHLLTPFAPLGFGFTLFVIVLYASPYTGGAVNTARAFGPAVIQGKFSDYHWIYWLGPTIGSLIATGAYIFLKSVHYWQITPGQDSTGEPADTGIQPVNSRGLGREGSSGRTSTEDMV
ncbi:hypothetical protein IAU60_006422 [Kwoniella sp. DSM 27419]